MVKQVPGILCVALTASVTASVFYAAAETGGSPSICHQARDKVPENHSWKQFF
jgi:hypothetical protein